MSVTHQWIERWQGAQTPAITFGHIAISKTQLEGRIRRAATWLANRGLKPGDVVALQMARSTTFLELHLAALALGVITLPLNQRYTASEVEFMLEDSGAKVRILLDTPVADIAAELAACSEHSLSRVPDLEEIGVLCYTSGTTGRPKGALIRQRNILATVTALHDSWRWTPDDILIHALPMFHIHGLFVAQHAALMAGAHSVWLPRFEVEAVWEAIATHRATVFMGVPTFYNRLIQWRGEAPALQTMRLFTSGSAPLSATTWTVFRDRFGHEILERYGMTEVGIVLSNPYDGPRVPGSVGVPLGDIEARVDDQGEIWIRGSSVFAGYLGLPDATAAALQDGWMRTGDFGRRDESGYIHLIGRRSDLILSGGFNVYPGEVEAVLVEHPAVRELAVFGVRDDDLGEVVNAAVVADCEHDELVAWCRARLSPYKCPRAIWSRQEMPRNSMGKILRTNLRIEYALGERWTAAARAAIAELIRTQKASERKIAAFDFDDSCIHGDIGIALLERFDASSPRDLVAEYEADCAADTRTGYAQLCPTLLAGRTEDEVRSETRATLIEALADGRVQWVDEVHRLISTLHDSGWEVWIVTASPEVVVQMAAAHYGVPPSRVIGMRVAMAKNGRYSSEILDPVTYRTGKLEALRERAGCDPLLAMGDSPSDEALLEAAEVGILIDRGDKSFRDRAIASGWHVVAGW